MAENMLADVLRPATEEIGKSIVAIVKRQCSYLCCFNQNVEMMKEEAKNLDDERAELQVKVDAALRNTETIVPRVTTWLTETTRIQDMIKDQIEPQIPNAQSCCLNISSRYSLSKKAKEQTKAMEKQRNRVREFDSISLPPPPVSALQIPLGNTYEFKSRKKLEDDIMNALSHPKVRIVGIGGMGGVGKTTMAKRIVNRMMEKKIVDEAVIVVVSQPVDMPKIQQEIVQYLALDLKGATSFQAIACRLHESLESTKRRIIVLDDIWEKIDLKNLGIPCGGDSGGCVTLLTSRDKDLLNRMEARGFAMENLPQEEAWLLFKDKVGAGVDQPDLVYIGEQVVKECKGLPVAIVTVGSALKGEMEKEVWQDALDQLKSSIPTNITDLIKDVYKPLRLSYDRLDSQGAKSLFLLCCLFPEDYNISLEDLALYGMGLNMFEGVQSLGQTRNRVRAEVKKLKSRSLLLEGDKENKVKMHDVIRDVAIFIAAEEHLIDAKNCKWISLFIMSDNESSLDHLIGSNFPEILLLVIHHLSDEYLPINENSILKEMQGLHVLSFKGVRFGSSPQIIVWPNNLVTLKFEDCNLRTLSPVGELLNLKVLYCNFCDCIEELPVEIGQLKCLKLLHLCECNWLEGIAPGIISQLVELEELKIWGSFRGWECFSQGEGKNVSLKELESLHKLTCLEIEIQNSSLAAEAINLSPTVVKFQISIGSERLSRSSHERAIFLGELPNEINSSSWIRKLLATTTVEALRLDGDGEESWGNLSHTYNSLKALEIRNCRKLKELVDGSSISQASAVLHDLELINLTGLEQLYAGPIPEGLNSLFGNLRNAFIWHCDKLRYLLRLERAMDVFGLLQKLEIKDCERIEEVIISISNGKPSSMTFPKLERLNLSELPSLKSFWKGNTSIEFPSLEILDIIRCEQLKSLVSPMESEHNFTNDENCLLVLCPQKVTFRALQWLNIDDCHSIKAIFSFSTIESFNCLESLRVERCEKLEEVLRKEKNGDEENTSYIAFPKLKRIFLWQLPSLTSFSKGVQRIDFPLLEILEIRECPKIMEIVNVSPTDNNEDDKKVKFERLKTIEIKECGIVSDTWFRQIHVCSFTTVCSLKISKCHKIRSLFSTSIVEKFISLTKLVIEECNILEEVIRKEEDVNEGKPCHITFPKLTRLELKGLASLRSLSKGIESIEFPWLDELTIISCPKLMGIIVSPRKSNIDGEETSNHNNGSFSILCSEKVKFRELKSLHIEGCHSISSVMSSSAVENFMSLEHLITKKCYQMKTLIMGKKEPHEKSVLFPSLEWVDIEYLPMLEVLCEWKCGVELPLLHDISISLCPQMKSFTLGPLTTPKLYEVRIDGEMQFGEEEGISDLNRFLYQHIMATTQVWKLEDICEPSQVRTVKLAPEGSLTPGKVVHLFYGHSGKQILALASNGISKRWKWKRESNHCNPSGEWRPSSRVPVLCHSTDEEPADPVLCLSTDEESADPVLSHSTDEEPADPVLCHSTDEELADPVLWYSTDEEPADPVLCHLTDIESADRMSNNANNPTQDDDSDSDSDFACIAMVMDEYCFMSTANGKFCMFDMETSLVMKTLMVLPPATTCLAFNPSDLDVIAIGMKDSTIQIYNWNVSEVKAMLMGGHQKRISGLTFSGELNILVSSGADGRLCVWRVDRWKKKKSCQIHGPPCHPCPIVGETSVQFHKYQYHLLVVHESQIAIYNPQLDCLRAWYPRDLLSSPISSAVYSCDGRMVLAGFCDGAVGIFDFGSLTVRCRIAPCAYLSSPIPSNDNVFPVVIAAHPLYKDQFALGMSNGEVYVIEPSNAKRSALSMSDGSETSVGNTESESDGEGYDIKPYDGNTQSESDGSEPSDGNTQSESDGEAYDIKPSDGNTQYKSNEEGCDIKPSYGNTQSKGSTSLENNVPPSIPANVSINSQQPSEY